MFIVHHATTLALLALSWAAGAYEAGCLVLWLHDASDIGIDLLKMCGALKFAAVLIPIFVGHFAIWVWLRLYVFGRCVIIAGFEGFAVLLDITAVWYKMPEAWVG